MRTGSVAGHLDVCKLLLEKKAALDAPDADGCSPLRLAVSAGAGAGAGGGGGGGGGAGAGAAAGAAAAAVWRVAAAV